MFARHSYERITLEQIASQLDMVPSALYHYFRDKKELIFQCYLRGLNIYSQELEAASEPGIDGLEIIRRFLRGRLSPDSPRMILFTDIDALPEKFCQIVHESRWKNVEKLAAIVQQGVEDGSVESNEPLLTSVALISILDWVPFWFSEHDYYTHQQAIDSIDDIVTHGVCRRDLKASVSPPLPDLSPFLEAQAGLSKRLSKFDQLLRIASDNFNRKGAMGASLEQIALDAGMTRSGIYYHFDSKEDLLYACLTRSLKREAEIAAHVAAQWARTSDYVIQINRLLLMLHDTPCGPKETYHNINYLAQNHRNAYVSEVLSIVDAVQERFKNSIRLGEFRGVDGYFAHRIMSGMEHWYPVWFRKCTRWPPVAVADHFSNMFLYGIKPRSIL
ncbi:TetR/AcrR family transcriptional regulator [Halomonas eurihalina]|uniref:TetR/AcrR family transcriptional regulator n=2 Tax=Halomonas eurihalina TaxID=42566 RepID=A0A5D9DB95_HALER|nr:TetR/AcrR family transcriptional regulator [Halomonas eurihalina]